MSRSAPANCRSRTPHGRRCIRCCDSRRARHSSRENGAVDQTVWSSAIPEKPGRCAAAFQILVRPVLRPAAPAAHPAEEFRFRVSSPLRARKSGVRCRAAKSPTAGSAPGTARHLSGGFPRASAAGRCLSAAAGRLSNSFLQNGASSGETSHCCTTRRPKAWRHGSSCLYVLFGPRKYGSPKCHRSPRPRASRRDSRIVCSPNLLLTNRCKRALDSHYFRSATPWAAGAPVAWHSDTPRTWEKYRPLL